MTHAVDSSNYASKTPPKCDFGFNTKDKGDIRGRDLLHYVGRLYQHNSNNKVFMVTAVTWLGNIDRWGLIMQEKECPGKPTVTRSVSNFLGKIKKTDTRRFTEVTRSLL